MRALVKIVLGGFLAFMVLAVAQEWEFFSSAWFGKEERAATLSAAERDGAGQALYLYLQVSSHYYASGGDPRFADRLPASEGVVDELRDDVDYLRRNGRYQDPKLARMEIVSAEPLEGGQVELQTREWWHVRTLWIDDGRESDSPRVFKSFGRYLLEPGPAGWRVEAWEPLREDPGMKSVAAEPASAAGPDPRAASPPRGASTEEARRSP